MIFKKEIFKFVYAAIFSLAVLFPSAIKFAHTFENHKHEVCEDVTTHLHQKQLDCSICDFHFSIYNFTPLQLAEITVLQSFQKTESVYLFPEFKLNSSYYLLRGPPLLS